MRRAMPHTLSYSPSASEQSLIRGLQPTKMPIIRQIPLPNRLAMILRRLIHPPLRSVHIRLLIRTRACPSPEQVLALVGSLRAGAVLHMADLVGEVIGPVLRVGGEVVVPLEGGEVFVLAALVLDVQAGLLVGGDAHFDGYFVGWFGSRLGDLVVEADGWSGVDLVSLGVFELLYCQF